MHRVLVIVAVLAAALAPAAPARAQPVSVKAGVSAQRVAVGQPVQLEIAVDGVMRATPPTLPELDGFTAVYLGASQNMQIEGGRIVERAILRWQLTPTRKGTLTIPAVTVTIRGRGYATEPITIAAVEPSESPDFRLRLEADKASAYVGEPVKVRLVWYVGKQVRGFQFTGPDGGDDYDITPGPDPRPGGARDDQRHPVFKFLGSDVVGTLGQGDMDGVQVTTLTLELIITPRRAGPLQLGPYTVAYQAVTGQRAPSFLDSPWDDRAITERGVAASNPLTLEVRPLPEEGRPAGFTGLIGEFGIAAAAGSGRASVGDPVPLTVRITGPEPLNAEPPDLASLPAFDGFKTAPEGWQAASSGAAGERAFTTTIRPRSDSVTEIPPVPLSYFDTGRGEYRTARSAPIPLTVEPTREVTMADAIGARPDAAAPAPVPAGRPLAAGPGGIHANFEGEGALIDDGVSLVEWAGHPLGALVLAGPPALCLALSLARGRRGLDPASRRGRALARARRMLRRAETPEDIGNAVRVYLGAALGAEADAITSADARARLTAAGSTMGERVAALLAESERVRFGSAADRALGAPGAAIAPAPPRSAEALALLADLHRELERLS